MVKYFPCALEFNQSNNMKMCGYNHLMNFPGLKKSLTSESNLSDIYNGLTKWIVSKEVNALG